MAGTEAACSATELEKFLAKQEIPPEVVAFVVAPRPTGRGLTSIADYGSVFTEKDYEDRVQTWILEHVEGFKDDFVALARLCTAWQLAKSEVYVNFSSETEFTPEGRVQVARPRDEEAAMTDDDRSIDGQPPNKKKKGNVVPFTAAENDCICKLSWQSWDFLVHLLATGTAEELKPYMYDAELFTQPHIRKSLVVVAQDATPVYLDPSTGKNWCGQS